MLAFTDEQFQKMKAGTEESYKSFGEVYCPYFQEKVHFNAKGLDHIKFKSWNRTRLTQDQYMRLKLLHLAPKVLKLSHTVQGIFEAQIFERRKINSRWEKKLLRVSYYEFIAVMENIRVKVIVKYVEGGEKFFWSIIPFWRVNGEAGKRILHNGNMEED